MKIFESLFATFVVACFICLFIAVGYRAGADAAKAHYFGTPTPTVYKNGWPWYDNR
jgi:hypothetical protein